MNPLKDIINFQKQVAQSCLPKELLQPFEKMLSSFENMDPGSIFTQFKDAVANLTKFSPIEKFQDFFKSLSSNSSDFMKIFQENLMNPMKMFQDLMGKFQGFAGKTEKTPPKPTPKTN